MFKHMPNNDYIVCTNQSNTIPETKVKKNMHSKNLIFQIST